MVQISLASPGPDATWEILYLIESTSVSQEVTEDPENKFLVILPDHSKDGIYLLN